MPRVIPPLSSTSSKFQAVIAGQKEFTCKNNVNTRTTAASRGALAQASQNAPRRPAGNVPEELAPAEPCCFLARWLKTFVNFCAKLCQSAQKTEAAAKPFFSSQTTTTPRANPQRVNATTAGSQFMADFDSSFEGERESPNSASAVTPRDRLPSTVAAQDSQVDNPNTVNQVISERATEEQFVEREEGTVAQESASNASDSLPSTEAAIVGNDSQTVLQAPPKRRIHSENSSPGFGCCGRIERIYK